MALIKKLYKQGLDIVLNPQHTRWLAPPLLALDALLCIVIIRRVPYTEIDWRAYMQQVQQYLSGEKNYPLINGSTGPLVYPAAHLYIYTLLYHLTDSGTSIPRAQAFFALLYLAALAFAMACYRRARAPPYVFALLVLSKRLHSIFVLRCFNDGVAVLFLWAATYCYQRRWFTIGSLLFSWGVGVKMTLLLTLPAMGVVLLLTRGVAVGFRQLWMMAQLQVVIAFPFLPINAWGYLGRAFEFSRVFLFKWTVNWRFVGEQVFLSREFSIALLVGHVSILALFGLTRWLEPARRPLKDLISRMLKAREPLGDIQHVVSSEVTSQFILTTVLTATVIGLLFARSLHYQFYAYLAWSTPFLLWRSGMHPILQVGLWAAQEWAWNVYPSTNISSAIVVGVMTVTLAGLWWGTSVEKGRKGSHDQRTQKAPAVKPNWNAKETPEVKHNQKTKG